MVNESILTGKVNCMSLRRVAWLVGVALLVMVVNVAASILYMVVYSYVIDTGHDAKYYEEHIQVAAPYCSIVAGIPLMFLAGWWVGGWWKRGLPVKAAVVVWLAYVLIDIGVLLGVGLTTGIAILFAVSFLTKLVAVYLGALFAGRSTRRDAPPGLAQSLKPKNPSIISPPDVTLP